jgi:Kef-type K+ transport system membrane component KefB
LLQFGRVNRLLEPHRLRGEPPPVATRIATLMNPRGLMQLIALNVGLQAGIVNHELFTVLVLVALITTVMTTPVLSWLDRADVRRGRTASLQAQMEALQ